MNRPVRNEYELGTKLRAARLARSLTQAELAAAAGVSRGFLTELERGKRPRAELTRVLAVIGALGLAIDLVDHTPPNFDDTLAALLAAQEQK